MRKIIFALLLFVTYNYGYGGVENILPKPQQVLSQDNLNRFQLQGVRLNVPDTLVNVFSEWIVEECGGTISNTGSRSITVEMVSEVSGAEFQEEAYWLQVTSNQITIKATTRQGAFWALQSLAQMGDGEYGAVTLPSAVILDWPAFPYRGYMHDIGRSYMEYEEVAKHIKLLSRYKINLFHWHLTEYQGWRLESKIYPQLNANSSFARHHGKYYTIEQAKEVQRLCAKYGMTVIPEIDMPGHSDAFTRAFGFTMQTPEGLVKVKELLEEACDIFDGTPWMHIGTDEVTITMSNFIPEVLQVLKARNRKVASWRPGYGYNASQIDMVQLWRGTTTALAGTLNIDCRFYYNNHFDGFADIVGVYKSNILGVKKRTADVAGVVVAAWNDRLTLSDRDVLIQNHFYSSVLAVGERAWYGGGEKYIVQGGTMLPSPDTEEYKEFADWERRFAHARITHLKDEPISYVPQSHAKWRITDMFPNNGNLTTKFAPEDSLAKSYHVNGKTYNTKVAYGSGMYLHHTWGLTVPGFYTNPQSNHTAYAFTHVYSPITQTVGAWIETQNYSRSEKDIPPRQGKWDYKESRIWVNDQEIAPPTWASQHTSQSNERALTNENYAARKPISITLNQGWNKILLKLPVGSFSTSEVRLVKWMFTFALVDMEGKEEIKNIIWSPDKYMDSRLDELEQRLSNARTLLNEAEYGSKFGQYSYLVVRQFDKDIQQIEIMVKDADNEAKIEAIFLALSTAISRFKNGVNGPLVSDETNNYYYKLSTPERGSRCLSYQGVGNNIIGEPWMPNTDRLLWKFVRIEDGTLALVSKVEEAHISPNSSYNAALRAAAGLPNAGGWTLKESATNGLYVITSGSTQFNQSNSPYNILNWGNGTNLTDTGCKYKLELIEGEDNTSADKRLINAISDALNTLKRITPGNQPGDYSVDIYNSLRNKVAEAELLADGSTTESQIVTMINELKLLQTTLNSTRINFLISTTTKSYWYSLMSNRNSRYVTYNGSTQNITGGTKIITNDQCDDSQLWKLIELNDGSLSLVSKVANSYISPNSTKPNPLKTQTGTLLSGGWRITATGIGNYMIITSGTVQFNQANNAPFHVLNWGDGVNTTDNGCQYILTMELEEQTTAVKSTAKENPKVWVINRKLYTSGLDAPIQLYRIDGTQETNHDQLKKGTYILKSATFTQKLVVQ